MLCMSFYGAARVKPCFDFFSARRYASSLRRTANALGVSVTVRPLSTPPRSRRIAGNDYFGMAIWLQHLPAVQA